MVTPESIQRSIAEGLACEHVEVAGDGEHFQALIVSRAFEGLSRIRSHQLVYAALGERMSLSQSALSQHLARLREDGIVSFRREAQTLFYHIADDRAARLLELLHDLYCPELQGS